MEKGFLAERPNFDLKIENVDFWTKNNENIAVEFYCHVRTDVRNVPDLYNVFTLRQKKHPNKVVIVGAERDVDGVTNADSSVPNVVLRLHHGVKIKVECRIYGAAPLSRAVLKLIDNNRIKQECREERIKSGAISTRRSAYRGKENFEYFSFDYIPDFEKDRDKSLVCSAFNPNMSKPVVKTLSSSLPFPLAIARLDILHPPSAPKLSFSGVQVYQSAYWVSTSGTIGVECSSDVAGNPVADRSLVSQLEDNGNNAFFTHTLKAKSIVKNYTFISSLRLVAQLSWSKADENVCFSISLHHKLDMLCSLWI